MTPYLDTNFLLRVYLPYEDSPRALTQLGSLPRRARLCPLTWLHHIEFANAIQLVVFQSRAGTKPRITPETAAVALHDFESDVQPGAIFTTGPLATEELERLTRRLSDRHTARLGCRTYDILHVASALLLKCDSFWSFDTKASALAKAEGLAVF
ncbi:MAG: type II toxin-antitoxin system VapC family toxin [Opitutaceae bacterium]|nr:type II toxin-antitoxin system VapC family toxin [Opitutaceae bacterium]